MNNFQNKSTQALEIIHLDSTANLPTRKAKAKIDHFRSQVVNEMKFKEEFESVTKLLMTNPDEPDYTKDQVQEKLLPNYRILYNIQPFLDEKRIDGKTYCLISFDPKRKPSEVRDLTE